MHHRLEIEVSKQKNYKLMLDGNFVAVGHTVTEVMHRAKLVMKGLDIAGVLYYIPADSLFFDYLIRR